MSSICLKIKDEVNLEKLENFGFKKSDLCKGVYELDRTKYIGLLDITLFIYEDKIIKIRLTRNTPMFIEENVSIIVKIIYDLTKAGLIEKVNLMEE